MKLFSNNSNILTPRKTAGIIDSSPGKRPEYLRKAGRIAATSLITGVLLLGCGDQSSMSTSSSSPNLNKNPVSFMVRDTNCPLFVGNSEISGLVSKLSKGGTAVVSVRKGDTLWRVDTSGRSKDNRSVKGHMSYDVADVDEDGVIVRIENQNPCEISSTYFRVNFDGSDTAPRPWASDNTFRAERTSDPTVAKLTLSI